MSQTQAVTSEVAADPNKSQVFVGQTRIDADAEIRIFKPGAQHPQIIGTFRKAFTDLKALGSANKDLVEQLAHSNKLLTEAVRLSEANKVDLAKVTAADQRAAEQKKIADAAKADVLALRKERDRLVADMDLAKAEISAKNEAFSSLENNSSTYEESNTLIMEERARGQRLIDELKEEKEALSNKVRQLVSENSGLYIKLKESTAPILAQNEQDSPAIRERFAALELTVLRNNERLAALCWKLDPTGLLGLGGNPEPTTKDQSQ